MLVLARREGERIFIGEEESRTTVCVVRCLGKVRLGIEAPPDIPVHREEIATKIQKNCEETHSFLIREIEQKGVTAIPFWLTSLADTYHHLVPEERDVLMRSLRLPAGKLLLKAHSILYQEDK